RPRAGSRARRYSVQKSRSHLLPHFKKSRQLSIGRAFSLRQTSAARRAAREQRPRRDRFRHKQMEAAMAKDDKRKAEEILKKRRLAAKGLKERPDGKAVDPMAHVESLDADDKRLGPENTDEREEELAERTLPAAAAVRR